MSRTRSNLHFALIASSGALLVAASVFVVAASPRLFALENPCTCSLAANPATPWWTIGLLIMAGVVLGRFLWALGKTAFDTQRFLRATLADAQPVAAAKLGLITRHPLVLLPNSAQTFCYGLLRPRIALGEQLMAMLDAEQLAAVTAHESAHADRRDPLRLAVVSVVANFFGWQGPRQSLMEHYRLGVELDADHAAVQSHGRRPLAEAFLALLALPQRAALPTIPALSITEERIRRLLGEQTRVNLLPAILLTVGIAITAAFGLAVTVHAAPPPSVGPSSTGGMCTRPPTCTEPHPTRVTCVRTAQTSVCVSTNGIELLSRPR